MMEDDESGLTLPPCYYCANVVKNGGQDPNGYTCKAFPKGVPSRITLRYDNHNIPNEFFGDTIVFEPIQQHDDRHGDYYFDYFTQVVIGKIS